MTVYMTGLYDSLYDCYIELPYGVLFCLDTFGPQMQKVIIDTIK